MAKSLALISGKGGCGKTTLSISQAQMLADTGKRVLLIDCDLATYGATCFYDDELENKGQYITFLEILLTNSESVNSKKVLQIAEFPNIAFIPSCVDFKPENIEIFPPDEPFEADIIKKGITKEQLEPEKINRLINKLIDNGDYDIVIYDCQAGYSVVTETILKFSDNILVVLEPDSVSDGAIRVMSSQLNMRIASPLADKYAYGKVYQVVNKFIKSKDTYQNRSLFKTVPKIEFDFNVKMAYSRRTPFKNINTSPFSNSICDIVLSVFDDSDFGCEVVQHVINLKKKLADNHVIDINKYKEKINRRRIWRRVFYTTVTGVALVAMILFFMNSIDITTAAVSALFTLSLSSLIGSFSWPSKGTNEEISEYNNLTEKHKTLLKDIEDLERKIVSKSTKSHN